MDYGRENIVLLEIDQHFCAREYGVSPCTASVGTQIFYPPRKCFNTRATCQDQNNYSQGVLPLRFSRPQGGVGQYGPLIPSIVSIDTTPAAINLAAMDRSASALGSREVVTVRLDDHQHSDLLVDKYRAQRVNGIAQKNVDAYASFPGTAGNYISTPDSAAIAVTGDIRIYVHAALTDWTPATINTLVAKRSAAGAASTSYAFFVDTTGKLGFLWSDGTTVTTYLSDTPPTVSDGASLFLAVRLVVDEPSFGGHSVAFMTSPDGVTYPQLGADVTNFGRTSIRNGPDPVEIGSQYLGTSNLLNGKVYDVTVQRFSNLLLNVGAQTVLHFDPNAGATGATSFLS